MAQHNHKSERDRPTAAIVIPVPVAAPIAVRFPRWKLELFRTRSADLEARGAAHAAGRAVRPPGG
jgi:hypothetical protein